MKFIGFIVIFICVFLFALSVFLLLRQIVFSYKAVVVPGTVVRYEAHYQERKSISEENKKWYAEVVSFHFNGQKREIVRAVASDAPGHAIGQKRKVAVNPDNVNDVSVVSVWNWLVPVLLLGTSVFLFLFFGLFLYPSVLKYLFIHFNIFRIFIMVFVSIWVYAPYWIPFCLGGIGSWLWYSRTMFFRNAIMVPGTIVRYEKSIDRDRDSHETRTMYTPVVSYSFNGESREIKSNISSSDINPADIGKPCQVGINPQNPYEVRIYSKWEFMLAIGLVVIGGLWLLLMVILKLLRS